MAVTLGIAGGGQLARMMLSTCIDWNYKVKILDKAGSVSQAYCKDFVVGDYLDSDSVYDTFKNTDTVTIDLEAVSLKGLSRLEESGVNVFPSPRVLSIIQNKYKQKQFFKENGIPTSAFKFIENLQSDTPHGFLKIPEGGYDGKGVTSWRGDLSKVEKGFTSGALWEEAINIEKEISVIGVRGVSGEVLLYEPTEMIFDSELNLISHTVFPSRMELDEVNKALNVAEKVMNKLKPVGVLAIELFLTKNGEILVNELAPRPHNSGHHTIESCKTSQFENHLRAVTGIALGSTQRISHAITYNIIGKGSGVANWIGLERILEMEDVFVHNYGKEFCREGRKMGHITITGLNKESVHLKLEKIKSIVSVKGE